LLDIVNFWKMLDLPNTANMPLKFVEDGLINHYLFQLETNSEETKENEDSSGKHLTVIR